MPLGHGLALKVGEAGTAQLCELAPECLVLLCFCPCLLLAPLLQVSHMYLDLCSFESIKAFAEAFLATGKKLNVLLCNAVRAQPRSLTRGFGRARKGTARSHAEPGEGREGCG